MHASVLRYFVAVADAGSIRRASRRLNISASAVNRQILNIEAFFGTPLFERLPGGMRLTDAGRLVHRHSVDTLLDFDRLRGEIDAQRGIVSGRVTIATLDSLTMHFLPEAVVGFIGANPAVEIHVFTGDPAEVTQAIAQGSADIGLTFEPLFRPGLAILHDIPCAIVAIMRSDHDLAGRRSVTLEDCGAYPMVYQQNTGSMQPYFGNELESFKNAHKPVVVSNTLAFVKRLLLHGIGIAFYTRLGFAEELAEGRLVAVPVEGGRLSALRLSLIAPSDRAPTVAARTMSEHLREALTSFTTGLELAPPTAGCRGPARNS